MKYLILILLAVSAHAISAPFVVSDPLDARCTHYGIYIDAVPKQVFPAFVEGTNKIVHYDLVGIAVGTHTVRATCIAQDPVWGDQESPQSLPLQFAKPSSSTVAPVGIRVVPQ